MIDNRSILRRDFTAFVHKAFRHTHEGERLEDAPYVDFIANRLQTFANTKGGRLLVNVPPRHLKTYIGSIFLPAWELGRHPGTRVIIASYSDALASTIAYATRSVMKAQFYKQTFETRLAEDRTKVNDFATEQGGSLFAASINGSITGRGADLLIVDDPMGIPDANNLELMEQINNRFDTVLMSRLNNAKTGSVLVIAHRLHPNDLSGHLRQQGDWEKITLPLIAPRTKIYDLGYGDWERKKGDLLRPNAFGAKEINRLRRTSTPDFETLYQQSFGGNRALRLKRSYFRTYETLPTAHSIVLSVDPGQGTNSSNSFSVVQAWCAAGNDRYLVDQWREQAPYDLLREAYFRFVRRYRPVVALIEATAHGLRLVAEAKYKRAVNVIDVIPDGRSKAERLAKHVLLLKKGRLFLRDDPELRETYIAEFLDFPSSKFDDQIDATTQYLDWMAQNPVLPLPQERAYAAGTNSRFEPLSRTASGSTVSSRGVVLLLRSRRL